MSNVDITSIDQLETEYHAYILRKIIFIAVFVVACIVTIAVALTINGLDLKPLEAF